MNLSLSGSSVGNAEAGAIDYALFKGALVIASAGNSGAASVGCPACDPDAISVAASDWLDEQAYYTQYGAGLDITAPGGEMYSNTTAEGGIWSSVRGGYAYFQGMSMATPQVTGTAAIVASVTGLTGSELRSRIEGTADDLGAPGYDTEFGPGRLNSYKAVTTHTLVEGPPPSPPPEPDPLAASFTVSCSGLTCDFDGSSSTGQDLEYAWSGAITGNEVTASTTFGGDGSYTVTLTVDDGTGTDSTSKTVQCKTRGKKNGTVCR